MENREFIEKVRRDTCMVLGSLCHRFGPEHEVTQAIANLCTEAAAILQAHGIQPNDPGRYDLSTLGPVTLSGDETGEEEGNPFKDE